MQRWQAGESTVAIRNRVIHIGIARSEGRIHISLAASIASACRIRNVDKCSAECEIKQHRDGAQESDAAKAADKQESENGVKNSSARDAFHRTNVGVDVQTMVVQCGEEVREDAKDDGSAAEFDDAEEPGETFESETAAESHVCYLLMSCLGEVLICNARIRSDNKYKATEDPGKERKMWEGRVI